MKEERGEDPRRLAKERLRTGFVHQSVRQLRELASLLAGGDPNARDTVAYELETMAATAVSFSLEKVVATATDGAEKVRNGAGFDALLPIAQEFRNVGARSRFPPIVIVAKEPLLGKLQVEASRCCEQIEFHETVASMHREFRTEDPEAVVVPYESLAEVDENDVRAGVYTYGPPDDFAARARGADAGVVGFLPERVEFRVLIAAVRARAYHRRMLPPRAVVLHDDTDLRTKLIAGLEGAGIATWGSRKVDDLVNLLKESAPDLVLTDATVADVDAAEIAAVIRAHPRFAEAMIASYGGSEVAISLHESGVDTVLDPGIRPEEVVQRLSANVSHWRTRGMHRDPHTGLTLRPGLMSAIDRAISEFRRGGRPVALAVAELDSLAEITGRHGRGAPDAAMRILGRCIESAIRANDLVGRIGGESFLILFPSCNAEQARRRLIDIRGVFSALVARDDRLSGLTFSAGAADTEDGIDRVLVRAEDALERARTRESRGAVG